MENIKTKVVHSKSKDAWNVINTTLGLKYKIAIVPYTTCGNEEIDKKEKKQALIHAEYISDCINNFENFTEIKVSKFQNKMQEMMKQVVIKKHKLN